MDFEWFIPIPDTKTVVTVKNRFSGHYTITSLKKLFQRTFDDGLAGLIEQNKKDKKLILFKN